jgi:hypothetical protein
LHVVSFTGVDQNPEYTFDLTEWLEEDDLDGPGVVTIDELAQAWCRFWASYDEIAGSGSDTAESDDQWASDYLFDSDIFEDAARYRALMLRLVHFADEDVLGNVAAGPLECLGLDDETIDWLVGHCETNVKLRTALGGMYFPDDLTEEQMCRLEAAAGITIRRPSRPLETPAELLTTAAQSEGGAETVNGHAQLSGDMWTAEGSQSV